ncbi:MAG TPA: hypothetical protein VJ438_05065 [Candidatus Nanoarchaeia archaeon]|nr:hypothetical protein [Candidatus Nanoarchaeia archaeon]
MTETLTKSALVCIGLKAGQQMLHDLDPIVMNDTTVDMARFVAEQYACKLGFPLIAAYTLNKAISNVEELILPKALRGILPIAVVTLGIATAMHYGGQYMNIEASTSFTETMTQLFHNYSENLAKLTTLNPEVNGRYLAGAALGLMSGARWIKNIGASLATYAESKRLQKQSLEQLA